VNVATFHAPNIYFSFFRVAHLKHLQRYRCL
jgi:hypothetical protein